MLASALFVECIMTASVSFGNKNLRISKRSNKWRWKKKLNDYEFYVLMNSVKILSQSLGIVPYWSQLAIVRYGVKTIWPCLINKKNLVNTRQRQCYYLFLPTCVLNKRLTSNFDLWRQNVKRSSKYLLLVQTEMSIT